jgi:hypothetical protein
MAKIVIFNEVDPAIGITLEEVGPGVPGRARGTYGTCTECGWPMHRWDRDEAIRAAQRHVDSHDPVMIGGDLDALVR